MTKALQPSPFAFLPDPGNFLRGLLFMVKVALFWFLAWLIFTSCTTTRPRPAQEPLLSVKPALHVDSLPAPDVRYRRPNYARSIPEYHADPLDTLPKNKSLRKETENKPSQQPKKGLFSFLSSDGKKNKSTQIRGNSTRKDKRKITYNIYNAPQKQKIKGHNVATDSGTVVAPGKQVNRSKDQSHPDNRNQQAKKADLGQDITTKTGFVVPGWVFGVLLLVLLLVFWRQFWSRKA